MTERSAKGLSRAWTPGKMTCGVWTAQGSILEEERIGEEATPAFFCLKSTLSAAVLLSAFSTGPHGDRSPTWRRHHLGGAAASPPPPRRSPAFSLPLREVGGPGGGPATCYGPHTLVSRAPFKLPLTARPRPVRGPLRPGFRRLLWSWKTPDCSRLRASLAHSARPRGIVKDLRPRGVGARQPSADGEEDREVRSSGLAERNTELELNRGRRKKVAEATRK